MSYVDPIDVIDTYGPNKSKWPAAVRKQVEHHAATDPDVAEYLKDAKRYEKMLNDWQMSDDDDTVDIPDDDGDSNQPEGEAPAGMIECDFDKVQDLDGMLTEAIMAYFEENDGEYNVFTRDYDELTEIDVSHGNLSMEDIDESVRRTTGPLQKTLRRLIAATMQVRKQPGFRRGRLHAPSLHRLMTDDDKVFYKRSESPAIDTAFTLLIDCSGSMNGDRLKLATETAYAIGTVLQKVGVEFECIGFTDNTDHPILNDPDYMKDLDEASKVQPISRYAPLSMPTWKTFNERWNITVQKRFAKVYNDAMNHYSCGINLGYTPEGCGIEFAARRLLQRPEQRKIMIVMTDGEAYVPGYKSATSRGERAQVPEVIKAVQAAGVEMVGIGINHGGVQRNYENNMVIQDVGQMPAELIKILKDLLLKK